MQHIWEYTIMSSHNVVFYIFLKAFLWQYNMLIVSKTINFLCQVLLYITTLLSFALPLVSCFIPLIFTPSVDSSITG